MTDKTSEPTSKPAEIKTDRQSGSVSAHDLFMQAHANNNDSGKIVKPPVVQGGFLDCHFIASVNDVCSRSGGVDELRETIKPADGAHWIGNSISTPDGKTKPDVNDPNGHYDKYSVKFPGYKGSISVDWKQVDMTGAVDDTTSSAALGESRHWPGILEAAGGLAFHELKLNGGAADENDSKPASYMGHVSGGGVESLKLLTGMDAQAVVLQFNLTQAQIKAYNDYGTSSGFSKLVTDLTLQTPKSPSATNPAELSQRIQSTIDAGGYSTACHNKNGEAHEYSILGTSKTAGQEDCVIMRNPQANNSDKDLDGAVFDGCKTDSNGNVLMPMSMFLKDFSDIKFTSTRNS